MVVIRQHYFYGLEPLLAMTLIREIIKSIYKFVKKLSTMIKISRITTNSQNQQRFVNGVCYHRIMITEFLESDG